MHYLLAKFKSLKENNILIETKTGIGYRGIFLRDIKSDIDFIEEQEYKFFIYNHKNEFEDNFIITYDEGFLDIVKAMLNVKSIGIKTVIQIIDTYSKEEIIEIINTNDEEKLTQIKSIGNWTAKMLIADLKLKLFNKKYTVKQNKLIDTLKRLGYNSKIVYKVIEQIDKNKGDEAMLNEALQKVVSIDAK